MAIRYHPQIVHTECACYVVHGRLFSKYRLTQRGDVHDMRRGVGGYFYFILVGNQVCCAGYGLAGD